MRGTGRVGYARVLVEASADKEFKKKIEVCYKCVVQMERCSRFVDVEYSWKPLVCSHCSVFGHLDNKCGKKNGGIGDKATNGKQSGNGTEHNKDGFVVKKTSWKGKVNDQIIRKVGYGVNREKTRLEFRPIGKTIPARQPTLEESKTWSPEMFKYFKDQWENKRNKNSLDDEDVYEENTSTAKNMVENVLNGLTNDLLTKDHSLSDIF
ncbi:zinc knuckle CX2CX4HX4C [Artemisia annua]|uniref:Zinc knuckle CX2CX4HX4C n=1 Tax=Artemisia annua TaxID=35608 RepID=A0A2U1LT45_ARTAN|nr:zinc knuckle CX2CX4HX4C [Artemisia annua]